MKMVDFSVMPSMNSEWLEILLNSKFFASCYNHRHLRKNEMNIYCVDCNRSICRNCRSAHGLHRLLQVRKYVYHDVVRLHDMQKFVDCSQVQTYIINGAKVVFLNARPQTKPSSKWTGRFCEICDRSLQEPHHYCSIACKASSLSGKGKVRPNSLLIEEPSSPESTIEIPNESGPWLDSRLKPKKPLHKRKGIPRRAPVC